MRSDFTPPAIAPVPPGTPRPFWSVMVPTYHCAHWLRQTLQSVLRQDPGPDQMQIEVVDDASTRDDPEEVVRSVAGDRVAFYRQPANVGAIRNFNACIERSRGEWVHLLHGDDYVLPGFYAPMRAAVESGGPVGIAHSRAFVVDEAGEIESLTPRLPDLEEASRAFPDISEDNPVATPAVIVRRSVYETHGGFLEALVHTADWEMWCRATRREGGLAVNQALACYRVSAANDTSRLRRTGENLRDHLRLAEALESQGVPVNRKKLRVALGYNALRQASWFRLRGDLEAYRMNLSVFREVAPVRERLRHLLLDSERHLRARLGQKRSEHPIDPNSPS